MDQYTIFDQAGAGTGVAPAREVDALADNARRDLDAALQLLAERTRYLTGASGASIAVLEEGALVCRASAGRAAPEVGVEIDTDSGLTAEGLRTRQLVSCDNTDSDPRVNRASCQELGVRSVMVMPLLRDNEVVGLFEVVADRALAFEERDVAAFMRLTDLALTALEHAEAAQRALPEISDAERDHSYGEAHAAIAIAPVEPVQTDQGQVDQETSSAAVPATAAALIPAETARIGSCQACGFPISQGRTWCVDCEQAGRAGDRSSSQLTAPEESWWQAHSYTIGTLLIAALTIVLLALKMR